LELGPADSKYTELKNIFEVGLGVFLDSCNSNTKLPDIFKYSLRDAGKRFRPVLSLAVAEGLGQDLKQILPFCIATELLHNSSLIHDDLPSLDDDSLRRGKETAHIRFGEAQAILAADALISLAFDQVAKADVESRVVVSWVQILSKAFTDLCYGQSLDIMEMKGESETNQNPEQVLETRHMLKTGALIEASILGPISISGSNQHLSLLKAFSQHLGLLFQITDDIEDHLELGASESVPDEATYVSLLGLDGAKKRASEVANKALDELESLREQTDFDTEFLAQLTLALRNRGDE